MTIRSNLRRDSESSFQKSDLDDPKCTRRKPRDLLSVSCHSKIGQNNAIRRKSRFGDQLSISDHTRCSLSRQVELRRGRSDRKLSIFGSLDKFLGDSDDDDDVEEDDGFADCTTTTTKKQSSSRSLGIGALATTTLRRTSENLSSRMLINKNDDDSDESFACGNLSFKVNKGGKVKCAQAENAESFSISALAASTLRRSADNLQSLVSGSNTSTTTKKKKKEKKPSTKDSTTSSSKKNSSSSSKKKERYSKEGRKASKKGSSKKIFKASEEETLAMLLAQELENFDC